MGAQWHLEGGFAELVIATIGSNVAGAKFCAGRY